MAEQRDLSLNENNDEEVLFALTTNQPADNTVLNLTGLTLEAFLKTTAAAPDADGWKGTSTAGDVTIDSPATAGTGSILIPHTAVTTDKKWWRLDVVDGAGLRKTALYGQLTVKDL